MAVKDVLGELRRELGMRQSVYPKWIARGQIDAATAARRINLMAEAVAIVERSMQHGQGELFNAKEPGK